jgi:anti-sigma regulatory factor (Ser/Thr protein kinase)
MANDKGRVLVVGDTQVLETIRQLSALHDQEIEGCRGEAEALRRLRGGRCDVIVTSWATSLEEDLAFLEEAREARPGIRALVLLPSAHREEVLEAMRSHVFAIFTTPFDAEEVGAMILRAIEERGFKDGIEMVSGLPRWVTLRVACRLVTAERLVRFMEELEADEREVDRRALIAAFRELLLNAMEHGAGFSPDRVVTVSAIRTERTIAFHFRDPGRGFRQEGLEHAAISNPQTDPVGHMSHREALGLRPGGFGILIAQRVADEMYYNEVGNEVLLIKYTTQHRG